MTVYPAFDPTSLFAGDRQHLHRVVSLAGLQAVGSPYGQFMLPRGTVLGRSVTGEATTAVKASGPNTGGGAITMDPSTPVLTTAVAGLYTVRFTSATAYTVTSPTTAVVGTGAVGTAFSNQVKFNVATAGAAYVAGDGFDIQVDADDSYVVSKAGATDGSQLPVAVLAGSVDTSIGAQNAPAYFEGEFAFELCTVDPSFSVAALQAITRQNNIPLYFRSVGAVA